MVKDLSLVSVLGVADITQLGKIYFRRFLPLFSKPA
jgi:ABC-type amino acid transport system permease subunit